VTGASIPYPVNYVINFSVVLAFAIVILTIAWYRYYKLRTARAYRQRLTGRKCLNLNMEGVKGRYPPKKIERLLKRNEMKQLREAEAAEKEYEIAAVDVEDAVAPANQEQPELKAEEKRSDAVQDHASASAAKAPAILQDTPRVPDNTATSMTQEEGTSSSPANVPVGGAIMPTFVLPDEQNVETGGERETAGGNVEFAGEAASLPSDERSVGQSQNNAAKRHRQQHTDQPTAITSGTTASTATQTYPQDTAERNASSSEGSFEDSVIGV